MTSVVVSSGITSVGVNLVSGDLMTIDGGGLAVDTTDAGALIEIFSGGVMSRTTLEDGASLFISAGGSAVSGTAEAGSEVEVASGGLLSNFTVSGLLKLDQGGFGNQIVIGQGGVDLVNTVAVSGVVEAGGLQQIFAHGLDEFGTVAGVQQIFEGEASQDSILSGGLQLVGPTGIANEEQIDSGGSAVISHFGDLFNSTVASGGSVTLAGEGIATALSGAMVVVSGGLGIDGDILSGGSETVSSGGKSEEDGVAAGGLLTALAGGLVSLTTLDGKEVVGSGGLDLRADILSGGLQLVSGGTASLGVVESGGKLQIIAGGVASGATVSSGGRLIVGAGGLAALVELDTGASAVILSGGTANGGLLDGSETVSKGGLAEAETVNLGLLIVRGSGNGDEAGSGGQLVALSGGVLDSSFVGFHGEEILSNGGTAIATQVAGGTEVVLSGGVASHTTIFENGQEIVVSGALSTLLSVSSGGSATVDAGGEISGLVSLASGATLIDGGQVLIANRTLNGILSGAGSLTEFAAHGLLVLATDGSAFGGKAVIEGGRIELAVDGAIGSGSVAFFGGNVVSQTLQIDAAAAPAAGGTFANTIVNFNASVKQIDLHGLAFVSGANATLAGSTLTLHDGGKAYHFHLGGLVGSSFSVAADGSGGTEITAHATAAFAQAAAVLAAPGPSLQPPVSGYGGAAPSPFHAGMAGGRG